MGQQISTAVKVSTMKYKIITHNDTGDQTWTDEYYIFAESDEAAENEALTRWLEDDLGQAAVGAWLYAPNGRLFRHFGKAY